MKRIISTLTAVATIAVFAPALQGQESLAIRGGLNLSTIGGDDFENVDYTNGFNVGAALGLGLTDGVGLEVGAFYSQMGAEETESGVTGTITLDYLQLPVLLQFGGASPLSVLIGPAFGFNLGCDVSLSGGGGSIGGACDEGEGAETFDFGGMAGLGVDLDINESLRFQGRATYYLGITDASEATDEEGKNRSFGLQVGLAFPIG